MKDLRDNFISGLTWTAFSRFGTQGVQFVTTFILARLLSPNEFGIIGLANIFLLIANHVNHIGISAAIIQKKDVDEGHLSTSFWINLMVGGLLTILIFLCSWPAARFFSNDLLRPVMQVLSLIFLLGAFRIVHNAVFSKKLQFRKLAMIEMSAVVAGGIVSVSLAFSGKGVWSLVYGRIANIVTAVSLAWYLSQWRPKFIFQFEKFKQLFHFGWNVMLTNIVGYANGSITLAVIGRAIDSYSVGLYSMTTHLIAIPSRRLTQVISQVMFPVFSRMQNDDQRFKLAYFKVLRTIAMLTFPLLVGLACIAPEFVEVVLGQKWIPIVGIMRALTVMGMIGSLTSTVGSIFCSKGRPDIELKLDILIVCIFLPLLFFCMRWKLNGVVAAIVINHFIMLFLFFGAMKPLLKYKTSELFSALYPPLRNCLFMTFVLVLYRIYYLDRWDNQIILLVTCIIIGATVYITCIRFLSKDLYKELKAILMNRFQRVLKKFKRIDKNPDDIFVS
ncbi:MAG: MOP flippase family protein [Candidatus Omnitrophica bacterium]|nr:MOP flippase family protein [Candidatus Omnitrophota bacterium]